MERMIESRDIKHMACVERIKQLEEENKNLKLIQETNEKQIQNDIKERDELREEIKTLKEKVEHLEFDIEAWKKLKAVWEKKELKLQIEIGGLMGERDGLQMVVEKLREENQTLELWLDNKEKLNGEYRKLIQKIDQLEEENENLRKDLFHLTNNGKAK